MFWKLLDKLSPKAGISTSEGNIRIGVDKILSDKKESLSKTTAENARIIGENQALQQQASLLREHEESLRILLEEREKTIDETQIKLNEIEQTHEIRENANVLNDKLVVFTYFFALSWCLHTSLHYLGVCILLCIILVYAYFFALSWCMHTSLHYLGVCILLCIILVYAYFFALSWCLHTSSQVYCLNLFSSTG